MLISHAVAYHPPKVRQMPPEDPNQKPKKKERRQYGHFENLLYKAGRNSSGWNPPASLSSLAPALNALQRRSMKPDIFELAPQEWLDGEPRAAHFFGDTFGSPGTRWVNRDGVGESSQTPGEWVEALAQLAGAIEAPAGVMNAGATPNGSLRLNPRHASLLEPDWVGLPAQLSSHFSVSGQFTQPHIVFGGGSLHRLVVMPGLNTDRPDESLDDCKPSSDLPPPAERLRPAAQTSPNPALVSLWRWPSSVENTIAFIKWDNEPRDTNEDQVARLQRLFDSLTGPVDWVSLHRHDAFVLHSGSVCMSLTMHGRLTVATGYPLLAKREEETYEAADFTLGVLNGILQLHKDGGLTAEATRVALAELTLTSETRLAMAQSDQVSDTKCKREQSAFGAEGSVTMKVEEAHESLQEPSETNLSMAQSDQASDTKPKQEEAARGNEGFVSVKAEEADESLQEPSQPNLAVAQSDQAPDATPKREEAALGSVGFSPIKLEEAH